MPFSRRRDRASRPARAGRVAAGRVAPPRDPRGHRGEGLGPAHDADPRRAAPDVRRRPDSAAAAATASRARTDPRLRYLAGLDAERARLDIKTMALEAHEPLWSMGDDTPTPGRARARPAGGRPPPPGFAQVTNPAIDPERERTVMDLRVELGRRPPLLGGPPRGPRARSASHGRSSSTSTASCDGVAARPGGGSGRPTRPGTRPRARRPECALDRLARRPSPPPGAARRSSS